MARQMDRAQHPFRRRVNAPAPGENYADFERRRWQSIVEALQRVRDTALAELAKLPSRREIIASLLGTLAAPVSAFQGLINSLLGDVVNAIGEVERKKAA